MKVPLLDLQAQYAQIQSEVEPQVLSILRSGRYIMSDHVKSFEKNSAEFLGAKHSISCANGSDALYISLLALDIGAGDEVITTPFTYIASSEAIDQVGAKPVFADIDLNNFNISAKEIEKQVTEKTKAIIIVHLFGQACDMDSIMNLASKHNLRVIEDSAQAFGTEYIDTQKISHKAGAIADIGTYSFYPTKNLSCAGDGGLMTTNSDELAARLRRIKAHGSEKRYYHSELGVNSRLDEIQAAVLNSKLKLIQSWNQKRSENAKIYFQLLKDLEKDKFLKLPRVEDYSNHIFHQFSILVCPEHEKSQNYRDELKQFLGNKEIGSEIYYPLSLHQQEVYEYLNYSENDFPNSLKASNSVLSIPIYPELNREQIEYVAESIKEFFATKKIQIEAALKAAV
ncbi:MAG: DegT/DnrJ/EryC1/StrS family aminotransferase [Candidatus Caenarcaniphilales bacterium]|nr:DegT/DnrJ/EryC1/StrS family aminotransferase [Candidatus Caenarcaniphilales bacterium]